ncbi:MAG: hypothetical protein FWG99_04095 [Treponema sp.]|nr:hypothetical protein [Treponema sp.]
MNTTPTIFNAAVPSYTVVGGEERRAATGLTAVILNRQGRYPRRTFFQELEKTGFDNVVSIESSSEIYDVEELSGRFPFLRFILPKTELTLGEKINLAALEIENPLFFVLWNDLKFIAGGTAARMVERLSCVNDEGEVNGKKSNRFKRLCTVPVILNSRYEILPTIITPVSQRKKMRTLLMEPGVEGMASLYPFDGVGIYDRKRFISLGGFDNSLKNAHWQSMDFGFRAYLWGEQIALGQQIKLSYDGQMPVEDSTAEASYRRFYLKNIAPVLLGNYAHLPLRRFLIYLLKSGEDPLTAWEIFSECRLWVKSNRLRWQKDAQGVIERWNGTVDFSNGGQSYYSLTDNVPSQEGSNCLP